MLPTPKQDRSLRFDMRWSPLLPVVYISARRAGKSLETRLSTSDILRKAARFLIFYEALFDKYSGGCARGLSLYQRPLFRPIVPL